MEHMEIRDILALMKAVADHGLTNFELEQGGFKLSMKRKTKAMGSDIMNKENSSQAMMTVEQSNIHAEPVMHTESGNQIICPLVGTFYSAPSPDAESFVKVGDRVKKGQVVGIVEAMKLMNEIESEYDGVVEAILVNNEEMVEYGQPLFVIR